MTLTISISQLRNNISKYLDQVSMGTRILIRDEKRGKTIAQITSTPSFNKEIYEKTLHKVAGIFTKKNHPEWRTKRDVVNWLRKTRLANERKF